MTRLPQTASLEDAYVLAWDEWAAGDDAEAWDGTAGDALLPASAVLGGGEKSVPGVVTEGQDGTVGVLAVPQ
jgi:hypothetical protein